MNVSLFQLYYVIVSRSCVKIRLELTPAGLGILNSILGLVARDDWDFRISDLVKNPDEIAI